MLSRRSWFNVPSRSILMTIVCGACLFLGACQSNQMTRTKAHDLLTAALKTASPATNEIETGYRWDNTPGPDELHRELVNKGLIEYEELGASERLVNHYRVTLTPLGAQFKVAERPFADYLTRRAFQSCSMRMADRIIVEVTGLRLNPSGDSAEVEFTWKYTDVTPFGELAHLLSDELNYSADRVFPASVTLSKYDDGWRLPKGWSLPVQKGSFER